VLFQVSVTAELFVSKLRLFPSADVQAAELGLDGVVTAGGAAEGTRVQLLSVASAALEGTLNWTVSRTYAWARANDGSGIVTEASQVPVCLPLSERTTLSPNMRYSPLLSRLHFRMGACAWRGLGAKGYTPRLGSAAGHHRSVDARHHCLGNAF
jgi:hypothetical protein